MRLLILAFLCYLLYRVIKGALGAGKKKTGTEGGGTIDEMVQDPHCKTYVPLRDAKRKVINGREYFFCSQKCADAFGKEDHAGL